ncbi:MAG: sugar phosphate nucleotidyltransferase [Nitrososphaerales archaeon]
MNEDREFAGPLPSLFVPVGGEATRLRPLTADVSKAGVRFLNRPLLEIGVVSFARQGVRTFIFGLKGFINYRSLHDYFGEGLGISARYGIQPRIHLRYSPNVNDVGSADSARISMDYYESSGPMIVAQSDNIVDINVRDFLTVHHSRKGVMTIALTTVEDVEGFGIAELDSESKISSFTEKPTREQVTSKLANTGIYVVGQELREIFKEPELVEMRNNGRLDFGKDLIPYLLRKGYPVYGYTLKGLWYDIGSPKAYLKAMKEMMVKGKKFLYLAGSLIEGRNIWVQGVSTESLQRKEDIKKKILGGRIKMGDPVLIGRHCRIGDGTTINSSSIDNFTIIGENVEIESSAVLDRSIIENGTRISDSIIGRHVVVKSSKISPSRISKTSVIGDGCTLGEGCQISGSQIYPHKRIYDGSRIVNQIVK